MPSEVTLVQGTSIRISTTEVTELTASPVTFATLDCIAREVTFTGGTASEIDVTSLCSTAKEFRLGLQDSGTMSVSGYWKQGHPAHTAIRTAAADKQTRLIDVTFEDGSIFRALAIVSQRSFSAAVDGILSATFNFRLTGETLEIDPA
jgi:predicted secreted protein